VKPVQRPENELVIFQKKIAGLSVATLDRFLLRTRRAVRLRGIVNVLVTGNRGMRTLNRQFRGKDKPTDVLSFPAPPKVASRSNRMAGELAISADIARENSTYLGHSVADEIKILVLHGVLHLAGFDHEKDNGEMARTEHRLRLQLKLERGLIERSQTVADKPSRTRARTRTRVPRRDVSRHNVPRKRPV
jgi:probable rRNA maturation factor